MLAVDPVKRITIPQILQHRFFTTDLPRYLNPLPPPPGPIIGPMSSLVGPPKALDFEVIDGLGDKTKARTIAMNCGVPVVPGTPGPVESYKDGEAFIQEYGFPGMYPCKTI